MPVSLFVQKPVFHEASLDDILSIINKKSFLLARPVRIGKPMYLFKVVVLLMPVMDVGLLILAWGVPEE
jgi:hypothetical protein